MEKFQFNGFLAPVFTPFNNDGSVNLEVIPEYAQYLTNSNITGVLVNGATGEGTSLTVAERKSITEVWSKICAETHQHLMVQIGGASFPDVIDMAKHAESLGVDSILCLPDLFHTPKSCNELIKYLQFIVEAAPNTPLLYYHIPKFTKVNLDMNELLNEVVDKLPTFVGIQYTSASLDEALTAIAVHDHKYSIILGVDTMMTGAFIQGFHSVVSTILNIFPEHALQIFQAISSGNIEAAQLIQNQLNAAIALITKNGSMISAMKETMNLITSINVGPVRHPLKPLTELQILQIKLDLEELKIIES